jgi:hypothetical protein
VIYSPLLLRSVAITSSLAPLLRSVGSSTSKPLPFRIAVQTLFFLHISYAEWLIPISPHSVGGSCKHTTSTLHSTPVASAAIVHSYDLAQLCWITVIIGKPGSRSNLSFGLSRGPGRNLSFCFGHCKVSILPRCLLFFLVHIRHLFFLNSASLRHPLGTRAKHDSVRARCHVLSCTLGSSSCYHYFSALPRRFGGFPFLQSPHLLLNAM